jgi:RimJ/RimL family protein N-acetyltransferase
MTDSEYTARGHGVRLRPFTDEDIDAVAIACTDPLTRRFLPFLPDPYGRAEATEWVRAGSLANRATGGAGLAIADPDTDQLLGSVSLFGDVNGSRRTGEIGYWVGPWARGRGVAAAGLRTLAGWAAGRGAEKLEILADVANVASQRTALACGFRREGVRRGAARMVGGGERRDLIAYSWLAGEALDPLPRLLPDLPGGYLEDGVLTLTPAGPDDVDDRYRLARLPEVIATSVPPVAPTLADVARRCAAAGSAWLAGERAEFMIRDAASHAVTGQIALFYWEPPTGQAMIGYDLFPEWRGRGYASRAARLVAQWAFAIGIKRLIAGTAPENRASQRTLENAGFRREGYQRSRLPGPDGTRIDDVLYALLPEDL